MDVSSEPLFGGGKYRILHYICMNLLAIFRDLGFDSTEKVQVISPETFLLAGGGKGMAFSCCIVILAR